MPNHVENKNYYYFSGYIWLDTKIVLKKANNLDLSQIVTLFGVNYILGPKKMCNIKQ